MADILQELANQEATSAQASDGSVEAEASVEVNPETGDMQPEDKAMLLLEVVQAALMLALDAGISADSKSLSFDLLPEGDVSIKGIDESGAEMEFVAPMDEILSLIDE